jgi:hypothetical protein
MFTKKKEQKEAEFQGYRMKETILVHVASDDELRMKLNSEGRNLESWKMLFTTDGWS